MTCYKRIKVRPFLLSYLKTHTLNFSLYEMLYLYESFFRVFWWVQPLVFLVSFPVSFWYFSFREFFFLNLFLGYFPSETPGTTQYWWLEYWRWRPNGILPFKTWRKWSWPLPLPCWSISDKHKHPCSRHETMNGWSLETYWRNHHWWTHPNSFPFPLLSYSGYAKSFEWRPLELWKAHANFGSYQEWKKPKLGPSSHGEFLGSNP